MSLHTMSSNDNFDVLLALLFDRGDGSVSDFYRCLEILWENSDGVTPENESNRVGGALLSRLHSLGLLLRFEVEGKERWFAGQNRILLVSGFAIGFGDASFQVQFRNQMKGINAEVHSIFPNQNIGRLQFSVRKYPTSRSRIEQIAADLKVTLIDFDPMELIDKMPGLNDCHTQLTKSIDISTLTKLGSGDLVSQYDFSDQKWKGVRGFSAGGLFQIKYRYGSTRTFASLKNGESFEILKRDWGLLLGRAALNQKINLIYKRSGRSLEIKGGDLSSIPDLMRNLLMGPALQWPKLTNHNYVFNNIAPDLISAIVAKYSVFEAIYEQ